MIWTFCLPTAVCEEAAPEFFRGLNLNGPSVVIDGHKWDGSESPSYVCSDKAFENQHVPLDPMTEPSGLR